MFFISFFCDYLLVPIQFIMSALAMFDDDSSCSCSEGGYETDSELAKMMSLVHDCRCDEPIPAGPDTKSEEPAAVPGLCCLDDMDFSLVQYTIHKGSICYTCLCIVVLVSVSRLQPHGVQAASSEIVFKRALDLCPLYWKAAHTELSNVQSGHDRRPSCSKIS